MDLLKNADGYLGLSYKKVGGLVQGYFLTMLPSRIATTSA